MKTYNYILKEETLSQLFEKNYTEIIKSNSILIQVFSGQSREEFENILTFLTNKFPNAKIIASSTDGEICEGRVSLLSSVISISTFNATELNLTYVQTGSSFNDGVELAKQLVTPKTKLLITFADGLLSNGEEFLNGIHSVSPHVKIAGGFSADNAKFENCYIGLQNRLYTKGAVAVAFDSEILHVQSLYDFGWEKIGRKHIITKSDKNRVYTIDDISAVAFYQKYLGNDIALDLPATGIEFPLIMTKEGIDIARAITAIHPDNSLSFAGNLLEGEEVYIGIGDIQEIISNPLKVSTINVETFFIYSCMARRRFLSKQIENELLPFAELAPTSGFFTYGEFYTSQKSEFLNQTLTAVSLSESKDKIDFIKEAQNKQTKSAKEKTNSALIHILKVTTQELQEENHNIQTLKKELRAKNSNLLLMQEMAHIGSWELSLEEGKISWSNESFKIFNRDISLGEPTYLQFINMVIEEDRTKVVQALEALKDDKIHSLEIRVQRDDGKILTLLESAKMIFKDSKPIKVIGVSLDLTDIRVKDNLFAQQSKQAQMGEMINMIAHQWRQPLNAISASAIQLSMKNDMDIITSADIRKTTLFIENITQEMSDTINDFMNFTKQTNEKENIQIKIIINNILHLMGAQLKNHNIHFSMDIEENLTIYTYKKDLEHVLINLISNARDAFDNQEIKEKIILFKAYIKNNSCIIQIRDNAGGIKENIIERLFEPYFTTKEQGKGTGLGLYMSKKILKENLGGDISVQNIQSGAEFTIELKGCTNE